jgi:plasmid maintenance system antidote protein VapI
VPQRRIGEIVAGTRSVAVDTGLRLSCFFGMSEGFWMGLQLDHDAAKAQRRAGQDPATNSFLGNGCLKSTPDYWLG